MTLTQDILGTITALRQRLEQAQSLMGDARADSVLTDKPKETDNLAALRKKIAGGAKTQQMLQHSLLQIARVEGKEAPLNLPRHLTSRAARLLQQTREAVKQLKKYSDESLLQDENHPAAVQFQDTVLLTDVVLRTIQTLPEQAALQMRLCSGVDVLLGLIQQRISTLGYIVSQHRSEEKQRKELTRLLYRLKQGFLKDINPFFLLAEEIIKEASAGKPLSFLSFSGDDPLNFVAGHCLTTARVTARIAGSDPRWSSSLLQPVVAALVHDAGMLAVPVEILTQPGPLNEQQRGFIERHCRTGANWLAGVAEAHPWLLEATRSHHERPDGTGYPAGLLEAQIDPLARLLAVCDTYTALNSPRPQRPALNTRAALKETLLQASKGRLDAQLTNLLLKLSYFPAGTAVELNDGFCGVVLAADPASVPEKFSRPVVALFAKDGKPLPFPQFVELSACEGRHVARSLTPAERTKLLADNYPHYL